MANHNFVVSDEELEELISRYCRDFTALERAGKFDPITGRDKEIQETILILLQKGRKNAALLAPAGVGKTAMVAGLAQYVVRGDVPDALKDARVLEIEMSRMAAGTTSDAEFQGRFLPLCKGFAERYGKEGYPKFVLFIDEFHMIMPGVTGSAYCGMSDVLKPYLTVGDLYVLAATTLEEYRMYVTPDEALDRRFQKVPLKVPNHEETVNIMGNLRPGLEKHHKLKISDECLELVVRLTNEFLPRRNQPDKSIVMLDGACAWHVMQYGWHGDLSLDDIRYMISIETKMAPDALQ